MSITSDEQTTNTVMLINNIDVENFEEGKIIGFALLWGNICADEVIPRYFLNLDSDRLSQNEYNLI